MSISNPNVPQGTLNRLRASVVWDSVPALNVTPAFLGKAGISLAFDSDYTTEIETMTGIVQSPEPYVMVTLTMNLLRTQALADAYKIQAETNTVFGSCTVRPDVGPGGLSPYPLQNVSFKSLRELPMSGTDPAYVVVMRGYYPVNSGLWNS